jgi:hypothetical protein
MTMSATGLEVFDETVHKTNRWLKEIEQVLGPDRMLWPEPQARPQAFSDLSPR